jgi:hypothetical protein
MDEFEALWLNSLQIAKEKAKYTGNEALVEYLDLKIRNDRTRFEASKLLFKSFTQVAQEKIAGGYNLEIETKSPHQFRMDQAVLTGHLLTTSFGIRRFTVEVGWTRKPEDGFMRKGALACAQITHFGKPEHNAQLLLLLSQNHQTKWFLLEKNGDLKEFWDFKRHVEILFV